MPPKKHTPPPKVSRKPDRPYEKGDITVKDQLKWQKILFDAGRSYKGFNQRNMDIIAISFEHKCFSEARNRREYKAKIRAKLKEWHYNDLSEEDSDREIKEEEFEKPPGLANKILDFIEYSPSHVGSGAPGNAELSNPNHNPYPTRKSKQPIVHHSPNHRDRKPSLGGGSSKGPSRNGSQSGDISADASFKNRIASSSSSSSSAIHPPLVYPGQPYQQPEIPNQNFRSNTDSPIIVPNTTNFHPSPPISTSAQATIATPPSFYSLFDPAFLSNIDLNNPHYRGEWIQAVYEFFKSGGHWGVAQSPANSFTPPANSPPHIAYYQTTPTNNNNNQPSQNGRRNGDGDEIMDDFEMNVASASRGRSGTKVNGHGHGVIEPEEMADPGALTPGTMAIYQEQWRKLNEGGPIIDA